MFGFVGFFLSFAVKNYKLSLFCFKRTLAKILTCHVYYFVSYRNILFKFGMLGRLKSVYDKWAAYYPCYINYSEYREDLGITFLSKWKWKILLKLFLICLKRYLSSGCLSFLRVLISTEHFFYQWWRYIFEVYIEEL